MTVEEWKLVREHVGKPLLTALLMECGYNIYPIQRLKYSITELQDRLEASIRRDKLEIKELKMKLEKEKNNYIRNLDSMFDTLRKLKGNAL